MTQRGVSLELTIAARPRETMTQRGDDNQGFHNIYNNIDCNRHYQAGDLNTTLHSLPHLS